MTGREERLVAAVRGFVSSTTMKSEREWLHELKSALAAYTEPPNEVFSQQVTWDSRAPASDASIGHTATAIGEEG